MKRKKHLIIMLAVAYLISISSFRSYAFISTNRIFGLDRYKTAVEISKAGWQTAENVVLVTGENFPDALCASTLAKQLNAPILLTKSDSLHRDTWDEIFRLGAKKAYIIGGSGVISENIKSALETIKLECHRIWGETRYDTAIAVATFIKDNFKVIPEVVVTTGEDFPDALSVSPIAAQKGMIILLSPKDYIPDKIGKFIKENGFAKTYVIGGSDIIGDAVVAQLPNVQRINGSNKYERNISILKMFDKDINFNNLYVATGENYPDALTGSALTSKGASAILLTNKTPLQCSKDYVADKLNVISKVKVLGGDSLISEIALYQLLSRNRANDSQLKVHFINVGQGDSILVQTPNGKNILIDSGVHREGFTVTRYLRSQSVDKIDALVVSHPHEGHIGAIDAAMLVFKIGSMYMPKVAPESSAYREVPVHIKSIKFQTIAPTAGTTIDIDPSVKIEVLAPNSENYEDLNNYSIVLKLTYNDISFLFTGDAETISEREILNKGYNIAANVLKVGHHGSSSSTSIDFLNAVKPQYAVISAGNGNEPFYPATETLTKLNNIGAKIYRTYESGTIVAASDGKNIDFYFNPSHTVHSSSNIPADGPGSRIVYYIINGRYYHFDRNCSNYSGRTDILQGTLKSILWRIPEPCNICVH